MKTRFMKILSLALALLFVLSAVPFAALPARAEDAADEPKVVQGLFGAKFSKYQVFDVQRQDGAYPQGSQEAPNPFKVSSPADPIKIAYTSNSLDFNLVPAFEETGYCYFAPVGKARTIGYTGDLSSFTGQDFAVNVDPFIVDMIYHAADGREMRVGRGLIGALSPDGFVFFYPAKNNSSYYYGVFVSTKTGYVMPNFSGSYKLELMPIPGGRVVNDRELLDNLITGQLLGKYEERPLVYTVSEWIWNEDNSEACAVFTCAETDDPPVTAEAELVTVGTTAATCTQNATKTVKAVAVMATQTFTSPERTRVLTGTATGHQWNGGETVKAATCIAMGDTKYTCTVPGCGATETRTDIETDAGNHAGGTRTADEEIVPGTCIAVKTWNEVTYCAACGAPLSTEPKTGETDPNNHVNTVDVPETDSTCIAHGCTAGVWCNDCESWVSGHEEKLLAEHTWQEIEREEANCRDEGYILYVCSVEGCGETKRETLPVEQNKHTFGIRIHPATCTEAGYTAYTCVFCRYGYTTDERPALGHSWGEPFWKWNGAAAEAIFVCDVCGGKETVKAEVSTETVTAPTETEKGKAVYTATVTFDGKTYADTVEKTLSPTGKSLCPWCGEYHDTRHFSGWVTSFLHDILFLLKKTVQFVTLQW